MTSSAATDDPLPRRRTAESFARALLSWHATHGRHDLPWQQDLSPYRVWVSEIMLQQTQVGTVVPYYQRFMARFPSLRTLADADLDDVLHHWTGLGYYARARNLHRAAQIVCNVHDGELPRTPAALAALPGIGRSTANAILAIAHGLPAPILDGNVKRVLSRCFAIAGDPGTAATQQRLWALAGRLTPATRAARYTQAIMDLGATVCTRARPGCVSCPLQRRCKAHAQDAVARFPQPKRGRGLDTRYCQWLVIRNAEDEFLLEQRPATGIWGGLWSFAEIAPDEDPVAACARIAGVRARTQRTAAPIRHAFSHFRLEATPVLLTVRGAAQRVMDTGRLAWYKPGQRALGLAAPVKRLIDALGRDPRSMEPP